MIIDRKLLKSITGDDYYSGTMLHKRFAYKFLRDKINTAGSIVAFRAPMNVGVDGLIDSEDLLANDYIYSDDAMNFCWEIPNLCAFGAVAFQRLFNTQIANILSTQYIKAPIEVDGDDLIVHKEHTQGGIIQPKGKCSVSITYSTNNVAIGHTGINITAGQQAPVFAYSTKLTDEQVAMFMDNVQATFYSLVADISVATSKCIV